MFFQARYASDFPVTNFFDNDGSNTLYVITKTNLWNSNGWWPYGPVYYRAAFILNNLSTYFGISSMSLKQEYIYFSSVLISLMACISSFFLVFRLMNKDHSLLGNLNLSLVSFFLLLLTSDRPFYYFILMPHPDYLLAFFVTLSLFFAVKYLEEEFASKLLYLSAIAIGIALSTKLSSIYFAISYMIGFAIVMGFSKKNNKLLLTAIGIATLAYLIVGFPQNFRVHNLLSFLSNQTRYHLSPDLNSIKTWFYHLFRNILPFLPLVICLRFQKKISRMTLNFLSIAFFFSFFILIASVNTKMEAGHYIFPYFFTFLIFLFYLKSFITNFKSNIILFLITLFTLLYPYPEFFASMIAAKDNCRGEIKRTLNFLDSNVKNYDEILIDAYAPYQPRDMKGMKSIWSLRTESFVKPRTLFALNWIYAGAFLNPPTPFYAENNPEWKPHQEFYTKIKENDSFTEGNINYRRLMVNDCGLEVWEAIKK